MPLPHVRFVLFLLSLASLGAPWRPQAAQAPVTAIVGATLIDGNGGTPIADSTIVIADVSLSGK